MDTSRPRARDIGLRLGRLEPGPLNGITDMPGVAVGHTSLVAGLDVRTGVTAIVTHPGDPFDEKTVAVAFVLNGFGKTCGLPQLAEVGLLETPILLTNTLCVPRVADALLDWTLMRHPEMTSVNPLVGECNDAFLNNIGARPVRSEHVFQAIAAAGSGPVQEGSVGAGVPHSSEMLHRKVKNQRLAAVGYLWTFTASRLSTGARAHYDRRRVAGDRHTAAQRHLFNRFLGCLHYCLQTGQTYAEDQAFPAAQQIAA